MKKITFAFMMAAAFVATEVNAQFKIVGYIRSNNMVADMQQVPLGSITHLNIAFINPDTAGNFHPLPALDTVINLAHARNIKVLLSCGGGSRHAYYAKLLSDAYRPKLAANFIAFVDQYNLDGIDVDIEGDDIDANYENFVVAISGPLKQRKKLLTAALAYYTRKRISDKALEKFDFVNLMAYDKTGPWKLTDPSQHSPISYAQDHLDYWRHERGVAKHKLIVGVPFYGYGFGPAADTNRNYRTMAYKDIISQFPGSEVKDEVILPENGGTVFYNGKNTIRKKTELAMKQGGGVMIWQLLHDTTGANSLLNVIYETSLAADKNKKKKERAK
jgi:chitinase